MASALFLGFSALSKAPKIEFDSCAVSSGGAEFSTLNIEAIPTCCAQGKKLLMGTPQLKPSVIKRG